MNKSLKIFSCVLLVLVSLYLAAACSQYSKSSMTNSSSDIESLAEEAYIYAYPMIQNYKTLYWRAIKTGIPANTLVHKRELIDPTFSAIVAPNNDTLYSSAWLDLRSGPVIFSAPAVPAERYYTFQFVDMYTHNFTYIGQRATGKNPGRYAFVGPSWNGASIPDVDQIFRAESEFIFVIGRMLAKAGNDQQEALALLDLFKITTLTSTSLSSANKLPLFKMSNNPGYEFIDLFNNLLDFVVTPDSEQEMFNRFKRIGVYAGKPFPIQRFSHEELTAINSGVSRAITGIQKATNSLGEKFNGWDTTHHAFGSRNEMEGRYIVRAAAAQIALYGNTKEESISFVIKKNEDGRALNGSQHKYKIRFENMTHIPAEAFWSLTMYRLPEMMLYANEKERYSIGDRTEGLHIEPDGSLTLYIQHMPPPGIEQANWLPAPSGAFFLALRIYLPNNIALNGEWKPPRVRVYD
jgi:hypothetical protein